MKEKRSQGKVGNTSRSKMQERILLIDSSVLMLPGGRKKKRVSLDTLKEVTEGRVLAVLDTTIRELKLIRKNKGKKGKAADLALELIEKMDIKTVKTPEKSIQKAQKRMGDFFDQALLFAAKQMDACVATTDLKLKKRLREQGIKVVYLRGKKRFSIMGEG